MMTAHIILGLFLLYLGVGLFFYWVPFLLYRKKPEPPLPQVKDEDLPFFYVVPSCHNAAGSLPGLAECIKNQDYPKEKFKVLVNVDNCSDNSEEVARSLGFDVRVRHRPDLIGKGYALNELYQGSLKGKDFDAVILFDIDARFDSDFFRKMAQAFATGAHLIQGSTVGIELEKTDMSAVEQAIQSLLRTYQRSRKAIGRTPHIIGSHGSAFSKKLLETLGWSISTQVSGDDLELKIRTWIHRLPMLYVDGLRVRNEVLSRANDIRLQRRRWTSNSFRIAVKYFFPLMKEILKGRFDGIDVLFGQLCLPSFANSLFLLTGLVVATAWFPPLQIWALVFGVLLFLHSIYIYSAYRVDGGVVKDLKLWAIFKYLLVRVVSSIQGVFLFRTKKWWLTPHGPQVTQQKPPVEREKEKVS